ncbi:exopolysaccharide biosynthesis protein [Spirulina subsalsa]|uniref:exopolysaccharide biosynthesis protein n=1 Tax=Spirulina subsalsa TaxID=54311 RepID=UPI000305399C|nr:exopolysaccharide biosynthesis protein [Spirulina subsalsa]
MAKLSVELNRYFFEEDRNPEVTFYDILTLAGERVFGILFVLLSLPSALPVPAPGYSIPFGVVMFLLAVQLMAGRKRPWLPERMKQSTVRLTTAQRIVKSGMPWLRRLELFTKPRLVTICTSFSGRVVIGVAISLMAICMMIPIPGTNTLPAMGIFITGFGLVEDDGIITLMGLVVCLMGGLLAGSIFFALIWGGSNLLELLKEWLGRS